MRPSARTQRTTGLSTLSRSLLAKLPQTWVKYATTHFLSQHCRLIRYIEVRLGAQVVWNAGATQCITHSCPCVPTAREVALLYGQSITSIARQYTLYFLMTSRVVPLCPIGLISVSFQTVLSILQTLKPILARKSLRPQQLRLHRPLRRP